MSDSSESQKRFLDLSEGNEEWGELSVEVPEELSSDGKYYSYTVRVLKDDITSAMTNNTFKEFWEGVEKKVLKDVGKEV